MTSLLIGLAIFFALDWMQAVVFNIAGDIRTRREGGEAMPPISLVLLNLRYAIRVLLTALATLVVKSPLLNKYLTLVLVYAVVILLGSIVETFIRFLLVRSYTKRLEKQGVEPSEKETM